MATAAHDHSLMVITIIALLLGHPPIALATTIHGIPHAFVTHGTKHIHHGTSSAAHKSSRSRMPVLFPSRSFQQRGQTTYYTPLASTTAKRSDSQSAAAEQNYNVLYQKVIRAPPKSHTFLLDLVSFLQIVFQLPNDLPMPYDITVPEDDEEDDGVYNPSANRAVLIIDSPLSNDPCDARLEVEVIGIFPDDSDTDPTMAMVALKKRRDPNAITAGNGMTQGLFAASEKRIAQSLDKWLQDLEEGRVAVPESPEPVNTMDFEDDDDGVDAAVKRIAYKNAIDSASKSSETKSAGQKEVKVPAKEPISIERDALGNIVIDAVVSPATQPEEAEKPPKKEKKIESKNRKESRPKNGTAKPIRQPSTKSASEAITEEKYQSDEDFAVKMARQQAQALMTTVKAGTTTSSAQGTVAISGGESDFAILAAKKAAASRLKSKNPVVKSRQKKDSIKGQESVPATDATKVQKGNVQDLSNDEMFLKLQGIASKAKQSTWKRTIPKMDKGNAKSSGSALISKNPDILSTPNAAPVKPPTIKSATKNKAAPNEKSDDEIRDDVMKVAKGNERVQKSLREATDMMQVEEEGEEGLSPEELLQQVLKFGDEKNKEEQPGQGFVEGAFGKAKELLRSEDGESNSFKELEFKDSDDMKRKAEEDELRRIFSAGQSVAEDRLSKPVSPQANLSKQSITEEDVSALIDADETVPRNARLLDEELAELEVRMSRSQDEESDGLPQNKVFDVFSGPEVYDPNVNPETAVNWPGAKEGTRTDVQLATDLSTALKQARFSATVLSEVREEVSEKNGSEVKYFVGTKELTFEKVALLQKCVNEAVKAGIIEDPETLDIERSRLQMLLDELITQPEERLEEITMNFKDLLLSDNLIELIRERLYAMAVRDQEARSEGNEDLLKGRHASERAIMMNLAQISQMLVKEAQALGAELEVSMLEIIRSICEVAMDPSHKDQEDTAVALTDAVRDMRPLLDDAFVAYLKYAIAEEEGKLAREGVVDDPDHNRWLFVLKIVQEGVYAELSQGVKRYVDHTWYVLRMKSKTERKELLAKLIDAMPTMDVRPFVKVVNNIVSSLGTTVKGDFTDGIILGEMTNQLLQLQRDVSELLPPERINELSKDADAWAAIQRERLLERRNLTKQRLEAGRQTGDIDPDEVIKKPGVEAERFD